MKTIFILILNCTFWCLTGQAQEKTFTVSLSNDSVLIGNVIKVDFTLQNIEGEFTAPIFEQMDIIAGPNVSSSYSMINGETKQTKSYTYILKPQKEGSFYIPPALFEGEGLSLETEALNVDVYPNPENIITDLPNESMMQSFQFNFDQFPFDFDLDQIFPKDDMRRTIPEEKTEGKRKLQKI